MLDACLIRQMNESDLPMVLAWRNHPEIRKFMFTQHQISRDEHRLWFAKASLNESIQLLIVEEDKNAIGYVQFSKVSDGGVSDWGFYARPGAPKGSGRKLGVMALNYAFGHLRIHKVCGHAIAGNVASISFHQSLGFTLEGVLRDQQRIQNAYHDLHCFGLLACDWLPCKFNKE